MKIKFINNIFTKTFYEAEEAALANNNSYPGKKPDYKVFTIIIVACFSLIFIEYIGIYPGYQNFIKFLNFSGLSDLGIKLKFLIEKSPDHRLYSLEYWVIIIFVFYFLIPALIVKFVFKDKLRNYGITGGKFYKDYKIYLIMLLIMIPLVWLFSKTDGFQDRYPFYKIQPDESLWPKFWAWEFLYFIQFFCVEFFFRGFLVHGLKKRFGFYSILIMTIPYCMIHFGKPMPETIAAIIAGIVLGTLSLKSRSIWMGVFIHYSVAILMDIFALINKGIL
jgi:membrane protease YdiL (CAAX protease family)